MRKLKNSGDEIELQLLNIWIEVSKLHARLHEPMSLCATQTFPRRILGRIAASHQDRRVRAVKRQTRRRG
jgi:hypothetical protein